jgi:hypothetical protein
LFFLLFSLRFSLLFFRLCFLFSPSFTFQCRLFSIKEKPPFFPLVLPLSPLFFFFSSPFYALSLCVFPPPFRSAAEASI